jgi:hypothetical protein
MTFRGKLHTGNGKTIDPVDGEIEVFEMLSGLREVRGILRLPPDAHVSAKTRAMLECDDGSRMTIRLCNVTRSTGVVEFDSV